MHIVILSDVEAKGGAGIAARRLAEALIGIGNRITWITNAPDGQVHPWNTISVECSRLEKGFRVLAPKIVWEMVGDWRACRNLSLCLERLKPDVINVHNIHSARHDGWFVDLMQTCSNYAPTVWTLHDMWSFTGRCVHSYDCRKFISGCDASCPTPSEYFPLEPSLISAAWQRRQRILATLPSLVAVTPSKWLAGEALNGLWNHHTVTVIPNGLPLERYRPLDRLLARQALDIQSTGPVLMVSATRLVDNRGKGMALFVEALRKVTQRPLSIITLGKGDLDIDLENVFVYSLGYVDYERAKILAYNAADLFVHPSLGDTLPNVVMEAIACGTPVVGFPIGGVPEMVRSGQTGWLADRVTAESLAAAINYALTELSLGVNLRKSSREIAETEYSAALQGRRYLELFQAIQGSD